MLYGFEMTIFSISLFAPLHLGFKGGQHCWAEPVVEAPLSLLTGERGRGIGGGSSIPVPCPPFNHLGEGRRLLSKRGVRFDWCLSVHRELPSQRALREVRIVDVDIVAGWIVENAADQR